MSWSAAQYSRFENERNRPIHDLLAQLPIREAHRVADIGCGPGNSTQLLQQRYPRAEIVGMDSSPDMLAAARARLPGVRFEQADIAEWGEHGAYDVILANAALQWVPDHTRLLPRLLDCLAPGGSLAVQIPDNLDEPAHRLMREIAVDGPWAVKLTDAPRARDSHLQVAQYYDLLRRHGATVNIWHTIYQHALPDGAKSIVEWFKGSGLRPFLAPLDAAEREIFLQRYEAAVAKAYPIFEDGTTLLAFPRLFFVATR